MNSFGKWDRAYMDTAERFASLSTAKRLKVGSIVVKNDRIISIGYNGMPSGWSNSCEVIHLDSDDGAILETKPEVIHAEANAIAKLAKSPESGENSTMYITHSPCLDCAKQIYASGITTVIYQNEYRSNKGIAFLVKCGIEVKKYE